MNQFRSDALKLSYDDVLIVPKRSSVESRSDVSLESQLFDNISLDFPVISSNMETVTESEMATAMSNNGGVGLLHRFTDSPEDQAEMIKDVEGIVGASVGIDEDAEDNAILYEEAGADFICVDVAHGMLEECEDTVSHLNKLVDIPLMAGNVATAKGLKMLSLAGADCVKVGVGPGSTCKTRTETGVGYPQFSAISEISQYIRGNPKLETTIVADGGITCSGDMAKALLAGADAVMIGGLLAGCEESPGEVTEIDGEKYKVVRGMASASAREQTDAFDSAEEQRFIEGLEGYTEYKGSVQEFVDSFSEGVQSACSYVGAESLPEAREKVEFIRVTESTQKRNGGHNIIN